MNRSNLLAFSAGIVLLFVACGGTAPATVRPGTSAAPGAGTPAPVTTPVPGGGGGTATGNECAALPTFSIENPNPSYPPDTALIAKLPANIGGSPAEDVETAPFGAIFCLGGQAAYNQAVAGLPGGLNWATVSFGSATYSLDGEDVQLFGFRTPGADSRNLVDALFQIAAQQGAEVEGTVSQASIGGKNALIITQTDGTQSYGYAAGDTLYFLEEGTTEAQAATVLAALP